jgi:hypothetical protein
MTSPLDQARQELLDAKAEVAKKDNPSNREQVELALAHLDYLLDLYTPPLSSPLLDTLTPGGTGAHTPVPPVSSLEDEVLALDHDSVDVTKYGDQGNA